jgi:hypothetical protein
MTQLMDTLSPFVQRYRGLLEISSWPRWVNHQLKVLAPVVHVRGRTAHRVV